MDDWSRDNFKAGDWNALCDRCGFEFKASELQEEWTGLYVCKDCWEPRHPMDFLRGRKDDSSVPWARPDDNEGEAVVVEVSNSNYTYTHVVGGQRTIIKYVSTDSTEFVSVFGAAPDDNEMLTITREDGNDFIIQVSATHGGFLGNMVGNREWELIGKDGVWIIHKDMVTGL